ncbi:MAG: hypothetical protein ACYC21_15260, partial [Eubacteriales bacterium]
IVQNPKTVASHVYSTPQANQVIRDIKSLFHKSPAQIEKILGRPDKPVAASEGGELQLKSGERVPTTVGTYKHGTVQINYLNGKAGHIWITLKGSYKYPADTEKLLTTYGIPVVKAPARVTPYAVDWENTIPGIFRLQFNTVNSRITDIGVIFLGAEEAAS